jgi:hypothetical protein
MVVFLLYYTWEKGVEVPHPNQNARKTRSLQAIVGERSC